MAVNRSDDTEKKGLTVLGEFDGECADSNITNLNGMDITREVWENVFNSDEYKKAIELGHYIGYLGHPEDPNCMDFEHACIVMTEGHIDDNGKVYGKFNLIDTPVGRIVKSFIDGGVTFGISVRGAGDIINNSVDPDTFVFRGFDLVTFPAFPESIPTFTAIAASTDKNAQAKYKKICASVNKNIDGLNTVSSVEMLQGCFAKQSDTYKKLEDRKKAILSASQVDLSDEQLRGMTQLYIDEKNKNKILSAKLKDAERIIASMTRDHDKKLKTIQRITSSQLVDMDNAIADIARNRKEVVHQKAQAIAASKQLRSELSIAKSTNLNYKRKIEASADVIREKESVIASLNRKLNETVTENSSLRSKVSNLGTTNTELRSKITAAQTLAKKDNDKLSSELSSLRLQNEDLSAKLKAATIKLDESQAAIQASQKLVEEYQDAYASMYANAIGVQVESIPVMSSTSVSEIQSMLNRSLSPIQASYSVDPTPIEVDDIEDDDSLITM